MFLGQYDHTIDEKGRLTIPARFREQLGESAFITQGLDQNLVVLPESMFNQMYQKVNETSYTDSQARMFRRVFFARAVHTEFDKTGRILIPQYLRDANGLNGDAVVVGVGDYFEVWSREHWHLQEQDLDNAEANQQRFAGLNLSFHA